MILNVALTLVIVCAFLLFSHVEAIIEKGGKYKVELWARALPIFTAFVWLFVIWSDK